MVITIANVNEMHFGSSALGLPDQATNASLYQPNVISSLSPLRLALARNPISLHSERRSAPTEEPPCK